MTLDSASMAAIGCLVLSLLALIILPLGFRHLEQRHCRRGQRQFTACQQHDDSVRFWLERQQSGTPIEQAIAPQMLALLSESAPPGGLRSPASPLWFEPTESDR